MSDGSTYGITPEVAARLYLPQLARANAAATLSTTPSPPPPATETPAARP